jgi:hypothetical protein
LIIGIVLGTLTGASGWGLLKGRRWDRKVSCIAGGATLGYSGVGVFVMMQFGLGRELEVLIRHGSIDWWDWSISHFQSPAFLEIPLIIWWIICLCTIFSRPEPRGATGLLIENPPGMGWVIFLALIGGVVRFGQIVADVGLYSRR